MKQIQISILCDTGVYKPVSTIINVPSIKDFNNNQKQYRQEGIRKICAKRNWDNSDLKRFGYTQVKCRIYDKEKIAKENAERYEQIKQEKYASGEWTPSKSQQAN